MAGSGLTGKLTDRRVVLPGLKVQHLMSALNSQHSLLASVALFHLVSFYSPDVLFPTTRN